MKKLIVVLLLPFIGCASFRNSGFMKYVNDRFGAPTTADLNSVSMREKYVKDNPSLTEPIKTAILKGEIVKEMSKKDVIAVMGNPQSADLHDTSTMRVTTWNYCFGNTVMGIDFNDDAVAEIDSRSGETGIYSCSEAGREMWIARRGRDVQK